MKSVFDERLVNLLEEHGVDIIDERKLNDNLELSVKGILTDNCAGKKCALWGAGRMNTTSSHSAILIGKYATYLQNLVCVIDSDQDFQGRTFFGYPIIAPNHIKDYDIDIIVISSKNSSNSIVESLFEVSPCSKYVDIYAELKKNGLEVYNNFFDERSIYTQIFDLQEKLNTATKPEEERDVLRTLISYYFSIRDFHYAYSYLDNYVEKKYSGFEKYGRLKNKIDALLNEIKSINSKKSEDFSMFYIDALRQKDVIDSATGEPKVLNKYIRCADVYTNVYSTGATTYESMVSAILGKYPLECKVYSQNFLRNFDEFEALKDIYDMGYQVNWMVSDAYRLIKEEKRLNLDIQIYMPKKLWNLSCNLAQSIDKTFNFIYFPYEIHCPMLCGYHKTKPVIRGFSNMGIEEFPESIEEQYKECVDYMDKQFDFYYELLGESTTKVIFSDHSQIVYNKNNGTKTYNMYYKDKELCTHVPFILSKKEKSLITYDGFLSLVDFNKMILSAVKEDNFTDLMKEIIRYQYYPIHSAKIRIHAKQCGYDDYIDGIDVFVSDEYIYIKTGTGKEEVYKHSDLDMNLINTKQGKVYINEVYKIYNPAF